MKRRTFMQRIVLSLGVLGFSSLPFVVYSWPSYYLPGVPQWTNLLSETL